MAALSPGRRRWIVPAAGLLAAVVVGVSPLQAWWSQPLQDWAQRTAAPTRAPAGVLIVDADDRSIEALRGTGAWPYTRDTHALLIDGLRRHGARAVVLQLLLAERRDTVDGRPVAGPTAAGRSADGRTLDDRKLAEVVGRPGAPVVLAAAGVDALAGARAADGEPAAQHWRELLLPAASVRPDNPAALRLGVVTTPLDDDGVLRHVPLWHAAGSQRQPSIALAALLAAGGHVDARWPVDERGRVQPLFGPQGRVERISYRDAWTLAAADVVDGDPGRALADAVRGRVVFVGSSALLAGRTMTVAGQADATEIAAQTFAALRDGPLVRTAGVPLQAATLLLALLPALGAALTAAGTGVLLAGSALAALGLLGAGSAAMALAAISLPLAAPLAALVAALAALLVLQRREQAECERRLALEREIAARSSATKSAFLATVSHEIRTPLNAVLGVADLMTATPLSDEQRRHVDVFRHAGQTLAALIDDLLDLGKIEAGRLELVVEPFVLRASLDSVAALLQPRAAAKGLRFVLDVDEDLPAWVSGDRRRVEQALTNLLGNAIKFTARGEVSLQAARSAAGGVRFTVRDTGIGIAPAQQALVFEPFVQADDRITRDYGGTGLGLAITRATAQQMGGDLRLESRPGVGSTFTLELPLAAHTPASAAHTPPGHGAATPVLPPPEAWLDGVLLAEDNELNVYIVSAMLSGHVGRLDVAADGQQALQRLESGRYDLVFMDMQMPGLDGLAATREWRRREAERGLVRTPIVALTANAYDEDVRDSREAGCDAHLAKPVSRAALLEAMQRWGTAPRG
ncbi:MULTISPECIES: CHASE2 domain-containing protein [unclassified Rubrivivax]|uniref:hybrid sensor histidine kinase/response regulator n=1 Tax=unclassified Rubrivivax TaxID=2649762 RepID=UPI001E4FC274|nr:MULTISPECIES: CHASE2 domain-containing protein [unclassified Rubrivivax]MCC9597180.1 CHASE2 domain-containing protein [Rubrivivax sp. JA1055]MCC9646561.1 CHASE2 domain-containing protein [Rubrivivax sp. JA1029]